ncbi:hypothetical protein SAMN05192529_1102 [Arachidicoccus rhizosphaerae]|uniref:Uncharacterized protein n=1 Tax=Arachidicoccus rhizosphaerae TaxID=551991 RepID=A0A1H3Z3M1_9BACT|nr:hypothetical protein [Arachidicoccus rhizosphaerae]SEA18369.1 hypothetical protein SAMN05192529_1102 [Arachidicoccus rhizosphaerae]
MQVASNTFTAVAPAPGAAINPMLFTVSDVKYYRNVPFEDYLKIPGVSFSSIKGFEGEKTEGMKLGERVHQYLNEPHLYDWQQSEIVRPIAGVIRSKIGTAFKFMEKELAFTCWFHYMGMKLLYKGRSDLIKTGQVLVDYKVMAGGLDNAINHFGYDRQISGYCLPTGCRMGIIISWNKNQKKPEQRTIIPDSTFWATQVVRLGVPA